MAVSVIGELNSVVRHTLAILRDEETSVKDFRAAGRRLTSLMAPYVIADLPTSWRNLNTPLEHCEAEEIARHVVLVPILRAGLSMVESFLELLPEASVCHIGAERNEAPPFDNRVYYNRLPAQFGAELVILLDPMNATGQSARKTMEVLYNRGARRIKFVCWIASPEGLRFIQDRYPQVNIYTAAVDRCLNEKGYICPGLGDAGDRIYGTKPRLESEVI